jgi:hypothetical protein
MTAADLYAGRHQGSQDNWRPDAAREQYEPRHAAPEPQSAEETSP